MRCVPQSGLDLCEGGKLSLFCNEYRCIVLIDLAVSTDAEKGLILWSVGQGIALKLYFPSVGDDLHGATDPCFAT